MGGHRGTPRDYTLMTFQDSTTQQQPPGVVDTGNGFLTGVEPAQPRMAGEWSGQQPPPQQQQPQQRLFTAEEVEAFRQQEKDKLYGRIDEMSTALRTMQEEREAERQAAEAAAREAQEAEAAIARAREEAEMDTRTLLEQRQSEWEQRFQEQEARYAADRAVFDQERRLNELTEYRRARIEQEQEFILPELRDMVAGNSVEEVDQSIDFMKQRTEIIAANFAAAAAQAPQQPFRGGAMPTVPPVGPLEQQPSYEQITPEWVAGLSMDEYKRHRQSLLQATNPNRRRGQ
jgi:hypothetical protein